jgi:hypothetical protein
MAYKSVAVIGLGTLGGFVAESISNLESIESLVIIDHDHVESKNISNSIYRTIDIGEDKAIALSDIISEKNLDIEIIALTEKYKENKTLLPPVDLVIDCRDITYNRHGFIDIRAYISSRYLIVDCRKQVRYEKVITGRYLTQLRKDDLRNASFIISMLIYNGGINQLIKTQSVQKFELDYLKRLEPCEPELLYEEIKGEEKFINLPENILPIINLNKEKNIDIMVGSRVSPLLQQTVPANTFNSTQDIITNLLTLVQSNNCNFNTYIVTLDKTDKNNTIIELIPETGAA